MLKTLGSVRAMHHASWLVKCRQTDKHTNTHPHTMTLQYYCEYYSIETFLLPLFNYYSYYYTLCFVLPIFLLFFTTSDFYSSVTVRIKM